MPTQEYHCPLDGAFDVHLTFAEDVPRWQRCPTCHERSAHVLRAPAVVNVKHTWNELANELQRDPYAQARAQLESNYNRSKDMGCDVPKPTEEAVQVVAREIAKPGVDHEKRTVEQVYKSSRAKARTTGGS